MLCLSFTLIPLKFFCGGIQSILSDKPPTVSRKEKLYYLAFRLKLRYIKHFRTTARVDKINSAVKFKILFKDQCFFGTEIRAFTAFYTYVVVYSRRVETGLRKRAYRAYIYRGAEDKTLYEKWGHLEICARFLRKILVDNGMDCFRRIGNSSDSVLQFPHKPTCNNGENRYEQITNQHKPPKPHNAAPLIRILSCNNYILFTNFLQ